MISVIIPTLNEEAHLPALLAVLARETAAHEIIVVDGGSTDGTTVLARRAGVQVIASAPGRGQQLRRGAEAAAGDVLLFLHADTRFPPGGLLALDQALAADPDAGGGNFRLIFDGETEFARWLTEFYAAIRARGIYYGDSGIFARRWTHDAVGGVPPIALMEDFAFARRLERHGLTLCIAEPPLVTSSRRFVGRRKGPIVAGWLWIHALYYLRVPSQILARLYDLPQRRVSH